jgi:hypothetical protein
MAFRFASSAFAVLGLSVACWLDVSSARADEAFLCGPDTVVYVKPEEMEHKKRTDPCIARYFGLTVEAPATTQPPRKTSSSELLAQRAIDKPAPEVALKSLQAPETAERVTPPPVERSAALQLPVSAPGTDYRNVKVLNASSPTDQWFKHTR